MKNIEEFMNSLGGLAEMTAIFYQALVHSGLSEDVAIALTAKMIREVAEVTFLRSGDNDESK